ncbi:MAG: hypothetical protein NVS1B4_26850 [Gemmatimonadaceae bacterium]
MDVRLDGVHFVRDGRTVLALPSLTFRAAATTVVFGPNGSGKTTLLRLIGGLEHPSRGAIHIDGSPAANGAASRWRTAFAFQDALFVRGTVRYNLGLGLTLRGVPRDERDARVVEVATACGIAPLLERSAHGLSGGEAQRANLARTLALRAPVTLLDEPLTGLDRIARARLLDELPVLLRRFAMTTIVITHDREEAFRLADDLVVLVGGEVRCAGPKRAVYAAPPDRETAALLGYTMLEAGGDEIAVPPDALRIGDGNGAGGPAWQMAVDRVIDMGDHRRVVGVIGARLVDVRLPEGVAEPTEGSRIVVGAIRSLRLNGDDRAARRPTDSPH